MGTKYSSNSASGYNATPPADDGTVSEANKVKWSTVKTKIGDPVKDLADTINTELVTHFDRGPTSLTTNTTLGATHYNQFIQASGSGVTLTLTDANTLGAGWFCDINSTDSSNTVALARATASNTIDAVTADVSVLPLEHLRVFVNAAANGFITDRRAKALVSLDAGAAIGPVHTLYRDSASPAASDLIGGYNFDGEDSAGNRETYAGIYAEVVDPGTTSEDGRLHFRTVQAGTLASRAYIQDYFYEGGFRIGSAKLTSGTASNQATLDILLTSYTAFRNKLLVIDSIVPASDGVFPVLRVSTDGGSTYDNGAGNYSFVLESLDAGTPEQSITGSNSATEINLIGSTLTAGLDNASTASMHLEIYLYNSISSALWPAIRWTAEYVDNSGTPGSFLVTGSARRRTAHTLDGIRLLFNTGNVASANYSLYGWN